MAALCAKCIIGGVLQNGSTFAYTEQADDETAGVGFHLEFFCELDAEEEESRGRRKISFDGSVIEGTLVDGLLEGTLSGQFDVIAEREIEARATVETFARRGLLAFMTVSAQDETGRTYFSANIRPSTQLLDPRRLDEMQGTVFLGWDDLSRADAPSA